MNWEVNPNKGLSGTILVPPSKSQTLRAILFASLAEGTSNIENILKSTDSTSMIQACSLLGAKITFSATGIQIQGTGGTIAPPEDVIHAGNSGIVLRFIAAIAALGNFPVVITGDHSIRNQRPMKPMLDALNKLGVSAISTRGNDQPPLIVQGPLKKFHTSVVGIDSQPVSSLLILGAFLGKPLEIDVIDPGEIPWIELTLRWMDFLRVPYEVKDYKHYKIGGNPKIKGFDYYVSGDMSSAAFPVTAAVITNSALTVKGLDFNDPQGDRRYFDILKEMGAKLTIDTENKSIQVSPEGKLKGITVDINDCIDCICILAVAACYAEGETRIINASVARSKECNRIAALVQELSKMGCRIEETDDGLRIQGGPLKGADVRSSNDHRMAMSLSVAGMGAVGKTIVHDVECTKKTYPNFYEDFKLIGAHIHEHLS